MNPVPAHSAADQHPCRRRRLLGALMIIAGVLLGAIRKHDEVAQRPAS